MIRIGGLSNAFALIIVEVTGVRIVLPDSSHCTASNTHLASRDAISSVSTRKRI
jgi:hypothetical protein